MQNFAIYILKVHIAITLLYLIYLFLLSNNVTFISKRMYLLISLIFAFVLPFVSFPEFAAHGFIFTSEALGFHYFDNLNRVQFLPTTDNINRFYSIDIFSLTFIIYLIISGLLLYFALKSLFRILKSIRSGKRVQTGKLCFIINDKYASPFSFFNYLFTKSGKNIEKTPEYLHELAHVQQFHSIDRLLVELLVPLLWINPFIYLFKKSLIEVHEHLADSAVIQNGIKPIDYQQYLFSQLKSGQYLKMTSNFNYSLTKKRITMISKNISKRKSILRTSISLLLVATVFIFYGFNNQKIIDPALAFTLNSKISDTSNQIPSILPLKAGGEYRIGSSYGMRKHPIYGYEKNHNGIDIVAELGTEVITPANGKVVFATFKEAYGNCIKIQHGEKYITVYAHLSGFNVKVGDQVKTNDVIGYVGSTGLATRAHLHYEVRKYPDNEPVTFYDPADYIKNIKEIPAKK